MHSGITISSGHYTASVKITDLNSLELDKGNFITAQMCETIKPEPLNEEEARTAAEDYDDGEVSFRVNGNAQPGKVLNKKNMEAVGLLGGQKSKSDCDLYSKPANSEKVLNIVTENRNPESAPANGSVECSTERSDQNGVAFSGLENKALYVLQSLKEYEGKWLLFDDSEVKVTEEKDFLNSLSPTSSSTSTPYLLFYKKIVEWYCISTVNIRDLHTPVVWFASGLPGRNRCLVLKLLDPTFLLCAFCVSGSTWIHKPWHRTYLTHL